MIPKSAEKWTPPARFADFVEWAELYLWVELEEGGRVAPFFLNSVQRYILEQMDRHLARGGSPRFIITKSRGTGCSTLFQAINYHGVATAPGKHALTIAHTDEDTEKIFKLSKVFHREGFGEARGHSKANKREFLFHDESSDFYIATAGLKGVGRGGRRQFVHLSETAWWPGTVENQRGTLTGILNSARHGLVVMESTPNGAAGLHYEIWEEAVAGQNVWCPIFITWPMDDRNRLHGVTADDVARLEEAITPAEADLVQRFGLLPDQVLWRRHQIREDGDLFPQEYPEDATSCFLRSGDQYFDTDVLVEMIAACEEPAKKERRGSGDWLEWAPPEDGHEYVIGADASEGIPGGDYSSAYVLDCETAEVVAALHGRWRPYEFAELLDEIGRRYNRAILAPEVNNHGHAVLESLTKVHRYSEWKIFRRRARDTMRGKWTEKLGWDTNTKTRPTMLAELAKMIRERTIGIRDRGFIGEALSFVRTDAGKYEAAEGAHDDRVVALAIAIQARQERPAKPEIVRL